MPQAASDLKATYSDLDLLRLLFGGKWRLAVLQELFMRPFRLSELRRSIPNCSKKVLIDTLHDLESLGLIKRTDLSGRVRRVEYRIDHAYAERMGLVLKNLNDTRDSRR